MNTGTYIFSQVASLLPKRVFDGIVKKYGGDKYVKGYSCWNHLMVTMYGQLAGCSSLREFICIAHAHKSKCYHLGFGKSELSIGNLSTANSRRDYKVFEEFAYHMMSIAQRKRNGRPFELNGRFFAFDSTTIDLCLSLFPWANFRKTKAGIKAHTLLDITTQIPVYINITNAKVADVNAMDGIPFEPFAYYIFDRGYNDFERLYKINLISSQFIVREKRRMKYEIVSSGEELPNDGNVILDQTIRLTGQKTRSKYPVALRRIVYYSPEHKRTFTFLTNNFTLKAETIAFLYKNRWLVECFFKWIKSHLRVNSFWGTTENAVRIQINVAIITYCLVAIIEHDLRLNRSTFDVLRIIGASLLSKEPLRDLLDPAQPEPVCQMVEPQLFENIN